MYSVILCPSVLFSVLGNKDKIKIQFLLPTESGRQLVISTCEKASSINHKGKYKYNEVDSPVKEKMYKRNKALYFSLAIYLIYLFFPPVFFNRTTDGN